MTMQLVLDDVAGTAVELVGEQRDVAIGPARPGLCYGDLTVAGLPIGQSPQCLPGHVPGALEIDRHHRGHLLHGLEGAELGAELLALADVAHGALEHRVRTSDEVRA